MNCRQLIGMALTAMISIHGGLTLVYLTLAGSGEDPQFILKVFLFGCLTVVIIPFVRCGISGVIQLSLCAKLMLAIFWYLFGEGWIMPEAFLSGLIASSSFYFALRELDAAKNVKVSSAILVLIINLQALVWYSALLFRVNVH